MGVIGKALNKVRLEKIEAEKERRAKIGASPEKAPAAKAPGHAAGPTAAAVPRASAPPAAPAAVRPPALTPLPAAVEKAPPAVPAVALARAAASAAAPKAEVKAQPDARRVNPDMVSLLDPEGPEAELFRLLRTRILFPPAGQKPPRTILVTSALAEEGKSFVAANLSVNFAQNMDEHVLLVDCDLRKPSISTKFGFDGVKGLSEYLAGGPELPQLLLKPGVEKLTVLPSGAPPPNPSELITSARMAALIEELKARYPDRYIILDSPPPMMAPETSAIAQWADGILVVVKYGTSMEMVEELMTHLDRDKIIGVVINRFNLREFRRYSYRKYYSYGKYHQA